MSKQKRVTMLLSNPFRPDPRVRKEARSLTENGHAVTILAWDREGSSPKDENQNGIRILRFGPRSACDNMLSMVGTLPLFYIRAFRFLLRDKADVIHCHDFDTLPLGFIAGRLKGAKVVYDSHESYADMIAGSVPGCVASLVAFVERVFARRVDATIVPSPTIERKFQEMGVEPVVTVMNCAELLPPPDPVEIKSLRESLASPGETLVMYIGTLERIRGIEETIQAFHKHSKGEFRLVIGGYGPIEKEVKDLCQKADGVTFIGPVKPDRVMLYNHASDIMLMLSDSSSILTRYGLANKIFESMSVGKPVIVSRGTLHEEVVLGAGSGISIKYFDEKELFEALRRLRDDRELYGRLSESGMKAAKTRYNWSVMAERLRELYGAM